MAILKLCDYGCGQEAKHQFKNGKWCCENNISKCPKIINKISSGKKGPLNPMYGKTLSKETKLKKSKLMKKYRKDPNSAYNTNEFKEKQIKSQTKTRNTIQWKIKAQHWMKKAWENGTIGNNIWIEKQKLSQKLSIKKVNERYPFFSKIEEMRYNPDNPEEKEIQVHCKNHNCKNSKEKGGWFSPTYIQLYERIRQLERSEAGCYFYCSQHCKDTCILFGVRGDPLRDDNLPYTYQEYQTCRTVVVERENGLCEYCGEPATDMHHIFPVKLEPFFALDPDYCVACCEKCHYKKGHQDECSTGNLAKIICKPKPKIKEVKNGGN